MIAMKMRNKNMVDFASPDLIGIHLHLGAFAAINQESVVKGLQYLGRRMPVVGGYCRIAA
jgi:hypothetical protein